MKRKGAFCERLPWDRPYHTDGLQSACGLLEDYYRSLQIRVPGVPVWSCALADRYPSEPDAIREIAVRQWHTTVRFRETIERMYASGVRVFVEVGPRGNLSAFIDDILERRPHVAVPLDVPKKSDIDQLCRALATLVAHGVSIDLEALYRGRRSEPADLASAPPLLSEPDPLLRLDLPELQVSDEWVPSETEPTVASERCSPRVPAAARPEAIPRRQDERATVFKDHQRTMREFLDLQRRVMTGVRGRPSAVEKLAIRSGDAVGGEYGTRARPETRAEHGRSVALDDGLREAVARHPLMDHVQVYEPSRHVVVECELDATRQAFLRDHTFGGEVSLADPSLRALPVMPVAVTMKLMAEAASLLCPGQRVRALSDVRSFRWLSFAKPLRRVWVESTIQEGGVFARVRTDEEEGASARVAECRVEFCSEVPNLGERRLQVGATGESSWRAGELYTRGLFHGPAFRSVHSIDGVALGEIRATLKDLDPSLLLGGVREGKFLLPVDLIDGAGQIVGFWGAETDWTMGFPTGLHRAEFAPRKAAGPDLVASARITRTDPVTWSSDVELCTGSGEVRLRVLGRTDRVPGIPEHFWRMTASGRSASHA